MRAEALTAQGTVASGFEPVREVFERTLAEPAEGGASFAAYVDERKVADLWGGEARPGQPWAENTIVPCFSVAKGFTAFVAQLLADRGQLDVDAPVARYWPEFAAEGKGGVTVRHVLSHTAGLPWFPGYDDLVSFDEPDGWGCRDAIVARLAAAPLVWEPGSRHGYHSISYGYLVGEIVRRVDGRTLGTILREDVAAPLRLGYWIGLPEAEHGRVAPVIPDPAFDSDEAAEQTAPGSPMGMSVFIGPGKRLGSAIRGTVNHPAYWSAEAPAANGVGEARAIARLYAMLARGGELDGVRLVSPESIARHTAEQVNGPDSLWPFWSRLALGYARPSTSFLCGPNDEAFGHHGLGGAIGFADPSARVGFGYTPTRLVMSLEGDPRAMALSAALYSCL